MPWSDKVRKHQVTGKVIKIYHIADMWYCAYDGRDVACSRWYPDVHRVFDHFEFQ